MPSAKLLKGLSVGLICASALVLSACGSKDAARLNGNIASQVAAVCPGADIDNPDTFAKQTKKLKLATDDGQHVRDDYIRAELESSSWVALDQLGYRTTAWHGVFGPGEGARKNILYYDPDTNNFVESEYEYLPITKAVSCLVNAPDMTRSDAIAVAQSQNMYNALRHWRYARNAAGEAEVISYKKIIAEFDEGGWQEWELIMPLEGETGATIIQRYFVK